MSNLAKDWQEGSYTVTVDGEVIAVSKKVKTGKIEYGFPTYKHITATARCAPEDEFSLSMGVALAMDRLNKELGKGKIEVGDKVKIKNNGLSYTTYVDWIAKNVNDIKLAACYDYNTIPEMDEEEYIVKVVTPWGSDSNNMLAYIQRYYKFITDKVSDNQPCYLVGINGLEKV